MLVKICGITNPQDAQTAEEAGADFIGLVFVEKSKRALSLDQGREILKGVKGRARVVGLFVNEAPQRIVELAGELGLGIVQLHGQESPEYVNDLLERLPECRILKAFAVTGPRAIIEMEKYYPAIKTPGRILGFLLDAPGGGGTGKCFDWAQTAAAVALVRKKIPLIFLAGGLTNDTISDAIQVFSPDGVDVSSGVEATVGRKDPDKVRMFIRLAKNAR